jgi:hypothetical protein
LEGSILPNLKSLRYFMDLELKQQIRKIQDSFLILKNNRNIKKKKLEELEKEKG